MVVNMIRWYRYIELFCVLGVFCCWCDIGWVVKVSDRVGGWLVGCKDWFDKC